MMQNQKTITPKNKLAPLLDLNTPQGISVEITDEAVILIWQWFDIMYILVALIALIWNGQLLFFEASGNVLHYISLPASWLALGLTYYVLAGFFNHTKIRVTATQLIIKHGPLPYWGHKRIDQHTISQLYIPNKAKSRRKSSIGKSYDLFMVQGKKRKALLTELNTPQQALYLKQVLDRLLQINNESVASRLEDPALETNSIYWHVWESFAQQHNLSFSSGKVLEAFCVEGDYHGYALRISASRQRDHTAAKLHVALSQPDSYKLTPPTPAIVPAITPNEITALFDLSDSEFSLEGKFEAKANRQTIFYKKQGFSDQVDYLQYISDLLVKLLTAYPKIVALGGEAVPLLYPLAAGKRHFMPWFLQSLAPERDHALNYVVAQLIQDISDSNSHLKAKLPQLVCPRCFRPYIAHKVSIPRLGTLTYYGCSQCHQSKRFLEVDAVIAVLDSRMSTPMIQQNSTLRVNWFNQQAIFDFEAIEIIHASDEDVERFAVQVGNDTDPTRKSSYKNMPCKVWAECGLSQNTMRILERTFGTVERVKGKTTT